MKSFWVGGCVGGGRVGVGVVCRVLFVYSLTLVELGCVVVELGF